jgi:hypothetical protein
MKVRDDRFYGTSVERKALGKQVDRHNDRALIAEGIEDASPGPDYRRAIGDAVLKLLEDSGFSEDKGARGERTFSREVKDTGIRVLVYTSIPKGRRKVRDYARDAIRVCAVYTTREGQTRPIGRAKRVNRVGAPQDIAERLRGRMREVWGKVLQREVCSKCGAPLFVSKRKNKVCAELCWRDS